MDWCCTLKSGTRWTLCARGWMGVGEGVEYYKLYMVQRAQLESCTITKADTPLLNCVKPDQDVKFTLKFQEFSPNLWGLEFFRGRDYYIISTSNSTVEGLDNQEGGVCKTKSMKIVMKVGQSATDPISPKEYPTRYPPKYPGGGEKDPISNGNEVDTHDARQRGRHERQRREAVQHDRLGGGAVRRHRVGQRHLHHHHHHAGAAASEVQETAPQALPAALHHAVAQHAGHAQARQRRRQQQRLGAQRHHHPAQDCRQRLLPALREGERGLRAPRLHRAGDAPPEPRQHLLQGLNSHTAGAAGH
ncbi:hypothetical protein ANANG_G00279220 [Anguilla anguilla]|uniref:Ephrin RBD domain-containing protein n=1 Tax=Anguilla anguilla TaxID=7936 RepID=A0A9D3LW55_ANGAN|nr:hypothetical protein ANANG_G00279220 [Anguilla anguilla]